MPHLKIEYTGNLEPEGRFDLLCSSLAATIAALSYPDGKPVFPLAGTRVLAYPAPAHAVGDGAPGQGFIYMNLRVTPGRTPAVLDAAGAAMLATVRSHFEALTVAPTLAVTLHIDEITPAFEGRYRP